MSNNDVVSCSYVVPISGCGELSQESNPIRILKNNVLVPEFFFIEGTFSEGMNTSAREEIVWNPASLVNVSNLNNTLTKIQGYNQFNAGGSSFNTVKNGGYFEYPVNATNKTMAVGLSISDQNYNYSSTNYAILLGTNGKFTIYESGSWRLGNQTYGIGDILKISVENNVVKYYRNENLVYTSTVAPTLPLIVDISLSSEGSTVQNAVVVNPNNGKFQINLSGFGPSPTLDWNVNSNSAGTNNTLFSYDEIENNDVITCTVLPDFAGCGNSEGFESNTIRFSGLQTYTSWIGATSSSWANGANWSYGVPDNNLSAKIGARTTYSPIINSLQSVKNIDVAAGTSLTILNEASLIVYGNFTIEGTFFPGSGKVSFNGSTDQYINGGGVTFYKLIINNTEAENHLHISSSISIKEEILFIKGKILTGNSEVVYLHGSDTRSANSDSFVDGKVRKIGNIPFLFPVGSGSTYAPIKISAPEYTTDAFTAEYRKDDPNSIGLTTTSRDSGLQTVSNCEYWNLDRVAGQSDVIVSLSYENERSCGIEDPTFLQVLHWNGIKWENKGLSSFDGDADSGMISSLNVIDDFSPFTIGSLSGINPLPIELSSFYIAKNSNQALLKWTTVTETNNAYFTIEKSGDATHFHEIGKINGAGTIHEIQEYEFVDSAPIDGINYYRLSQTDFDGHQEFFDIKSIYFEPESGLVIFPNPTTGEFSIQRESDGAVQLQLVDNLGKIKWEKHTDQKLIQIRNSGLDKGIYFLNVTDGVMNTVEKVIIH